MAEEIGFENGKISNSEGLVTLTVDLDLGSGHTAYRRAWLIDLYLRQKSLKSKTRFVYGLPTDGRTDGRTIDIWDRLY